MSATQPIKDKQSLKCFKNYYLNIKPNPRNHTMIVLGLNTAFRISDLLSLQWNDVWNDDTGRFNTHICIKEHKTGKMRVVPINTAAKQALMTYRRICKQTGSSSYLFPSTKNKTQPLSRYQAYRIIKSAATYCGLGKQHISCHSLRKTFGYHAWKQGTPPVMLMELYNHSSYGITKRYLGIEQDEKDSVYMKIDL